MNVNMKILLLIIALIPMIFLCSCKPKGDAKVVIDGYYQNVMDSNFEGAYEKLCQATKQNFSKDDFILWQNLNKQTYQFLEVKIELLKEHKALTLEDKKYNNVIEYNVVEKVKRLLDGKEDTVSYTRKVVNDNGVWKIFREKDNTKKLIVDNYILLAEMYDEGKGKEKDLNQAASILKEALKLDENYAEIYYRLSSTYIDLERYDEALADIDLYIEKTSDNEAKSNGYNVQGIIYGKQGKTQESISAYKKALELDSDNEYAKTNLNYFN